VRVQAGVDHPRLAHLHHADYVAAADRGREGLLQAVATLNGSGRRWRQGDNPFPGLQPFTEDLSEVFFGRSGEAREVANRLRSIAPSGSVLAIVGPSGCGKSSLLRAAVLPLFTGDAAWVVAPIVVPGVDPVRELAVSLATTGRRLGCGWTPSEVRDRLEATGGLVRVVDELLGQGPIVHNRRLLLPIDQGEELFNEPDSAVHRQFARLLRPDAGASVQVIVTLRSEFLDDLRHLPELNGVSIEVFVLAPLDREKLRAVVEHPARVAGLRFDGELAADLVADTEGGEALPLLAFTLHELAADLNAGGTLSVERYKAIGGVRGALARHADAALAEAVRTTGLTEQDVLAGLIRLVTVDDTGRQARRRVGSTTIDEPLHAALPRPQPDTHG
jgi:energy-coupling factor transporter ATP-binding protein EcfA2